MDVASVFRTFPMFQGLVLTEKAGFVIPDLAALAAVGEGAARGPD